MMRRYFDEEVGVTEFKQTEPLETSGNWDQGPMNAEYERGWNDGCGSVGNARAAAFRANRERDEWKARYEVKEAQCERLRAVLVLFVASTQPYSTMREVQNARSKARTALGSDKAT